MGMNLNTASRSGRPGLNRLVEVLEVAATIVPALCLPGNLTIAVVVATLPGFLPAGGFGWLGGRYPGGDQEGEGALEILLDAEENKALAWISSKPTDNQRRWWGRAGEPRRC